MEQEIKKKIGRPKGSVNKGGGAKQKPKAPFLFTDVSTNVIGDVLIIDLGGKAFKKIIFTGSPSKIQTEQI